VKKNQKRIQVILLLVGVLLILFTYFYPNIAKKDIEKDLSELPEELEKNTTSFENLQYEGLFNLDKTFIVKSEKAYIDNEKPDIVHMTAMHVILYLKDGRIVNITSDGGKYNKISYDIFFNKNVYATDGETKIYSEYLEMLGNERAAKIYNDVNINYSTGSSLSADKVEYDFETKYLKISMFDDKRIKMKVFK
jgi:LPS export ABC transporter protein LptC